MPFHTPRFCRGALGLVAGGVCIAGTSSADTVYSDDVIVQRSLCVGRECVDMEGFGDEVVRLKQLTLRLKFQDTSSPGYPSNDWQITVNDANQGGANYFAIEDLDGENLPFIIQAGAPENALVVADSGFVGIGTNDPQVDLHILGGNSPALRLEQNLSQNFTPWIWDIVGNEYSFFVRDGSSNGSMLIPFRIEAGAPEDSFFLSDAGRVGIGTKTPLGSLHILRSDGTAKLRVEETSATAAPRFVAEYRNNGAAAVQMIDTSQGGAYWAFQSIAGPFPGAGSFMLTSAFGPGDELVLQEDGDLFITGALTQGSDRNAKIRIEPVDVADILEKVRTLPVAAWTYRNDASGARHLGPMAQDFHATFGLGEKETGISSLDSSGVALAAIKALAERNKQLAAANADLSQLVADLAARIDALERAARD